VTTLHTFGKDFTGIGIKAMSNEVKVKTLIAHCLNFAAVHFALLFALSTIFSIKCIPLAPSATVGKSHLQKTSA
jgi:hypothetical protein